MKIGVVYPQTELKGDPIAVKEIGLATENLGYDHLLAYDHVVGATHDDREPELAQVIDEIRRLPWKERMLCLIGKLSSPVVHG